MASERTGKTIAVSEALLGVPALTATRGVVAAMAMTGLRRMTVGLGLVQESPPEEVAERGFPRLFGRVPPEYHDEAIELAHWTFGGVAGASFAALPGSVRRQRWVGPTYGVAIWLVFEAVIAPALGLRRKRSAVERAMLILDHALFGAIVGAQPRRL